MSTSIRLKNSSALVGGKAKVPTPSDLAQGELAVNTNKDDPSLFVKDSEGVVRKIAGSDATGVEGEYLSLAADAGDQTVASTGTTDFAGDVTLGTDKITLDATDGSATFSSGNLSIAPSGRLDIPSTLSGTAAAIRLYESSDSTPSLAIRANGTVRVGKNDAGANGRILINSSGSIEHSEGSYSINDDGSASFAGDVIVSQGNNEIKIANGGFLNIKRAGNNENDYLIDCSHTMGGASATRFVVWGNGSTGIGGTLNPLSESGSNANIKLNSTGSADFAGTLTVGDNGSGSGASAQGTGGAKLLPAGVVDIYFADADNDLSALIIRTDRDSDRTTQFRISAAGNVYASGNYFKDGSTPLLAADDAIIWTEPDNDDNYTVTTEEYEEQEELTPYIPAVDPVVGPLGNVLVEGTPAIEATYQTVTKTREIRTYTGPTLDVKTVIQDLQQRVNDRDAVIADLTTRIAALEAA